MVYIINMKKNFLPPSYWRYKKGPDLNLAPQSTIYSYGPDNVNFLFVLEILLLGVDFEWLGVVKK